MPGRLRAPMALALLALTGCTTVGEARIVSSRPNTALPADQGTATPTTPTTGGSNADPPDASTDDAPTDTASTDTASSALVDIALDAVMDLGGIAPITDDDALLAAATADVDRWAHETLRDVF